MCIRDRQKWEYGSSVPELDKLIKICKYFDVSLDALVLESDTRITEELSFNKAIKPKYANLHEWESYSSNLLTECQQSIEEGLDIEPVSYTHLDVYKRQVLCHRHDFQHHPSRYVHVPQIPSLQYLCYFL